jgi:CRP-like cAMP-binding protein
MLPPLVLKLARVVDLTAGDVAALGRLGGVPKHCPAGQTLVEAGRRMAAAVLVHQGWAIRHRTLRDGRRQVMDFVLPGDICDPTVFVTPRADFSMQAITGLNYSLIQSEDVLDLVNRSPRIGAAFWWAEAHEEAITRAHLVAIGRLSATERMAYLFWELWTRLRAVNLASGDGFELPATQELIADAAGLSFVHVSRTLRQLQRDGVIRRAHKTWQILDVARLRELAQITGGLHLGPLPKQIQQRLKRYL